MTNILLIDDDFQLLDLLSDYLEKDGFKVQCVHSGRLGIQLLKQGLPDLVVLDVMMPDLDGIQVLTQIRSHCTVPVIMLTARGDDADRISGLELGADDYVAKPCSPRELAARIRAILKRSTRQMNILEPIPHIDLGLLTIWPSKRKAMLNGTELALSGTEFSLLEVLARYSGQPVSKMQLSEEALGRPLLRFERSIDVHISSIREKIGQLSMQPSGTTSCGASEAASNDQKHSTYSWSLGDGMCS